jgi:hypothetical protein
VSQSAEVDRALELLVEQHMLLWRLSEEERDGFAPDEAETTEYGYWRFEAFSEAVAAWTNEVIADGTVRERELESLHAVPRLDEGGPFGRWLQRIGRLAPIYGAYAATVEMMRLMVVLRITNPEDDPY